MKAPINSNGLSCNRDSNGRKKRGRKKERKKERSDGDGDLDGEGRRR